MKPELLALYAGPDQIMAVTSGIAAAFGAVLMFWNRVIVACGKVLRWIHASDESGQPDNNVDSKGE